jgi:hypothetical protein
VRERLIKPRTALVNEKRGLSHEYVIILSQDITKFPTLTVHKLQEEQRTLTALSTEVFWRLYNEFWALEI